MVFLHPGRCTFEKSPARDRKLDKDNEELDFNSETLVLSPVNRTTDETCRRTNLYKSNDLWVVTEGNGVLSIS